MRARPSTNPAPSMNMPPLPPLAALSTCPRICPCPRLAHRRIKGGYLRCSVNQSLRWIMKPMSKNGSSTGTAPKKACRRPRWLGPLLEDPMYRRMRKALIREIAPETVLEWIEAEEYVISQYQSMRFGNWQKVILEHCQWDGIKRAVKRRLRQRCPSDPEDELEWKAGRLWPTMAPSIEPTEIEVETLLARQPALDS